MGHSNPGSLSDVGVYCGFIYHHQFLFIVQSQLLFEWSFSSHPLRVFLHFSLRFIPFSHSLILLWISFQSFLRISNSSFLMLFWTPNSTGCTFLFKSVLYFLAKEIYLTLKYSRYSDFKYSHFIYLSCFLFSVTIFHFPTVLYFPFWLYQKTFSSSIAHIIIKYDKVTFKKNKIITSF